MSYPTSHNEEVAELKEEKSKHLKELKTEQEAEVEFLKLEKETEIEKAVEKAGGLHWERFLHPGSCFVPKSSEQERFLLKNGSGFCCIRNSESKALCL